MQAIRLIDTLTSRVARPWPSGLKPSAYERMWSCRMSEGDDSVQGRARRRDVSDV